MTEPDTTTVRVDRIATPQPRTRAHRHPHGPKEPRP